METPDKHLIAVPFHTKFSSVQSLSRVQLLVTPWTPAHHASLSITNPQSLLKLMSIESVMSSNHLILCHPLFLLPCIFPSIRVFSSESVLYIRCPKYWSFSFSISLFSEYLGLLFIRIDLGTLKSLLPTTVEKHQFFSTQLYSPTLTSIHNYWKNHSLTRRTFVGKIISLLFKCSLDWS